MSRRCGPVGGPISVTCLHLEVRYALIMASRLRRLMSFSLDSSKSDIVNSNEQRTGPIYKAPSPDNYEQWNIPRIEVDTIYK